MIIFWLSLGAMLLAALGFIFPLSFRKESLILLILFPLTALSLYWHWGHSHDWVNYEKNQQLSKILPDVTQITAALRDHLAKDPNSAEGWYLLGRMYASQRQFKAASIAFAKANAIQPHHVDTLVNYAESLFMQQNPLYTKHVEDLLNEALQKDPQNDAALNLLAINYYQQKNYQKAILIWEKLAEKYPPDTPDGKALLEAIANAEKKA